MLKFNYLIYVKMIERLHCNFVCKIKNHFKRIKVRNQQMKEKFLGSLREPPFLRNTSSKNLF